MTANNSTVLQQGNEMPLSYSDYIGGVTYNIFRIKAMLAGASAMVYKSELKFSKTPALLDAAYILDESTERLTKLAAEVSNTEFTYQAKVEKLTVVDVEKNAKSAGKAQYINEDIHSEVDAKLNVLQYALTGLREEAKCSQITVKDIESFERLVGETRANIREIITSHNVN